MRLTVLGKSPSWQDAGGACSGYLLEDETTTVLIDAGNGVFSKLREQIDYVDVDAVVISHLHADHFLDLIPYAYALSYAPRQQPVPVPPWPGTDEPRPPAPDRAARGQGVLPRCHRQLGPARADRDGVRARGVRRLVDARGRHARLLVLRGPALRPDLRHPGVVA